MSFELMSRQCDQCLMTAQRIVRGARAAQIIRDCRKRDVSFLCHKSPTGRQIACRGHFDTGVGQMGRIAERLGMVVEIDPTTLAPLSDGPKGQGNDGDAVPRSASEAKG